MAKPDPIELLIALCKSNVSKTRIRSEAPFRGLWNPGESVGMVTARFLYIQFYQFATNVVGWRETGDPERLHDLRVGLRRFRAAQRLFGRMLKSTSSAQLSRTGA